MTSRRRDRATTAVLVEEVIAVRSAILRFLLTGLVVLLAVSIPATFWVRTVSHDLAKQEVLQLTQQLADYVIGPVLTAELMAGQRTAVERTRSRLVPWMTDEDILRIKVWDAEGTILYSDVNELIGATFPLEPWARDLLAGGPNVATLGPQEEGENIYEAGSGDLLEVYVLAGAGTDQPLLFEVYFDDEVLRGPERKMLLGVTPVFLVAMGGLQAAQLIPAVRLARRVQRYQRARRALLQQAIEAGEQERARLARHLHDDIVQDLAGLAYVLDSVDFPDGAVSPSGVLQGSIRKLREVTSDLYSKPLGCAELPAALAVLVERTRSQGIRTIVDMDEPVDLEDDQATMLYRIAREALMNIMKHANAKNVQLRLKSSGGSWSLRISDDGQGFDVVRGAEREHFGLRMMADAAELVGARLELASTLGGGTSISVTTGGRT